MSFVLDPPPQAFATIDGGGRFPIRRIFCVGRNYADHVREMGNDPKSEPPIFFSKPADAVVPDGATIPYALNTDNLHYEVELVLAIGKAGVNIVETDALSHIWGYGVGVDLTRRDRQAEAKKGGAPWDAAKAFDNSAPLSALRPASAVGHPARGRIWLSVNGQTKQGADIADMIWSVPEIIAHLSRSWALRAGDLVFTGTPSGVGPLVAGDQVTCGVDGVATLRFEIGPR
ncbi:MAG: fumarylacetoacetate hydrolase family protein [Caulobacterales bacterium]|nr:fumarylacetoacetate hydrolase family protein [Caulobacterales bacterium]